MARGSSGVIVLNQPNPFTEFTQGFMPFYMQSQEEKKKREQNQALVEAYLASQGYNPQAVEPYRVQNEQAQLADFDAKVRQEALGMANQAFGGPNTSTAGGAPVTPDTQNQWQQKAQQAGQVTGQAAASAADILTQAEQRYTPKTLTWLATAASNPNTNPMQLIQMAETMDAKERLRQQEATTRKAFSEVFSNKGMSVEDKINYLLSSGVKSDHPVVKALIERSGKAGKLAIAPNGQVVNMETGLPVQGTPTYAKPEKPTGQLTEYQRYKMQKEMENPPEKTQNIPGFGNISNAQILSLYTSSQPKEVQREVFNPITGQKEVVKSIDPGKPETIALLKPYVDKIRGVVNQPAQTSTGANEPPIDEVIASVKSNGEEQTLKLLTEAFGAKKAEELLGRSRAYSR